MDDILHRPRTVSAVDRQPCFRRDLLLDAALSTPGVDAVLLGPAPFVGSNTFDQPDAIPLGASVDSNGGVRSPRPPANAPGAQA